MSTLASRSSITTTGLAERGLPLASEPQQPIRLLVFTSLYPNALQPSKGLFVEQRLRQLIASNRVTATVVAPVPWFPFRHPRWGRYAAFARVPAQEQRHGITIVHPRYLVIPKLGMNIAPALMVRALLPVVRKLQVQGPDFDLIDAHYFYPDGVAATRIGAAVGKPVVISARGSDVTWIPRHRVPRRQIQAAAQDADAIITVASMLKDKLVDLDVEPNKITVLRNGVGMQRFGLRDRGAIRAKLGLVGPVWLAVGNLIEVKGVHVTMQALADVPDVTLMVAGQGPLEAALRQLADRLGIATRVRFLGGVANEALCDYYNAADALVLASSREGTPNVVLEALASGTPVILAPFDGAVDLVESPVAGQVAEARTGEAIRASWQKLRAHAPDPAAVRRYAQRFDWAPTIQAQLELYAGLVRQSRNQGCCHAS